MKLSEIKYGQRAIIEQIGGEGSLRQHFLDMGVIPGTEITYVKAAPMGDPIAYRIWGYELTLRLEDAKQIDVTLCREVNSNNNEDTSSKVSDCEAPVREHKGKTHHPGLGEMGIFHVKQKGEELSEDTCITFGLAGNQNCGKTTLFNQLTGSNQHVGNFPGVTVDRKDGALRGKENTVVTDLPGVYSLAPYSAEEIVTREFLIKDRPKGIINIVDATNIERNLYLTMQLMELDIPMVLALNMMDEVSKNGGTINVNELESVLGIPVVPISAARNEGIHELVDHAYHVAKYRERPGRKDFCDANGSDGGAIHRCLHSIMHLIEDHAHANKIPTRFAASRLVEGDEDILKQLKLDANEQEALEHIIMQMETESGMDRMAAIAHMRFTFIKKVCDATVVKPHESKEHARSRAIDRILTGKYTAIPSFVGIMALVFWLTFAVIGSGLSDILEGTISKGITLLDKALTVGSVNSVLHSLVIDGICAGVGSVLSFLPIIVTLFFFLSILEDSGYMARVAFVMDKLLRKIGLSGRSFVPMLIGFGCSVPAIMATRTLPSERDRKMT
ncbi:MAG: ferrous iron transport protein B, partial [Lachnospiraceae bacterium]|nr:ferrous iron transport protein B [Lachnospiraceae bacterium]